MRKTHGALVLGLLVTACGGGADEAPPVAAPPPPVAAPPPAPVETAAAPAPAPAPKASMADMEQATLKAFAENFTDAKKLAALYAEDAEMWMAGTPDAIKGRASIEIAAAKGHESMSNVKFGLNREWVKGDMVALEWTLNATQSKELMGVPATEKPWGVTGCSVLWFNKDGLIVKDHRYSDATTIMGQLGASKQKVRGIPPVPSSAEIHVAKNDARETSELEWLKALNGAFDKHDVKPFLDAMSDDVVYDDMSMPAPMKGKAAGKQFFESFNKAFPDLKLDVSNAFAVEDFVVQEYVINGTHKGPLVGPQGTIPATKKTVALHGLDVMQVKDGKLVHGWTYANGMEFASQLGLMPPHGEKAEKDKGAEKGGPAKPAAKPAPAAAPAKK